MALSKHTRAQTGKHPEVGSREVYIEYTTYEDKVNELNASLVPHEQHKLSTIKDCVDRQFLEALRLMAQLMIVHRRW